jgi:MFS family permease
MWTFSTTSASIVAFACLYGLFSGSFTVLLPPYIAQIVPRENFGARLGSVYIGAAIASLIGPTVAGSFFHDAAHITQAEFNRLIVFTGVSMLGGGAFFVGAHVVGLRQKKREAEAR